MSIGSSRGLLPVLALPLVVAAGCSLTSDGLDPSPDVVNFPVAVVASESDLFVVNSNFDLAFNGAAVQRVSRAGLEAALTESRQAGHGGVVEVASVEGASSVIIDSHAASARLSLDGRLLYVPVRSRGTLTVLRVLDGGGLDCGQAADGRCGDGARFGDEPAAHDRSATLPPDPVGVAVGDLGVLGGTAGDEFVVVGHRGGRASLFTRSSAANPGAEPQLLDVLGGLPLNHVTVALEPGRGVVWMPSTFLNDDDNSDGQLGRVGVVRDPGRASSTFLFNAGAASLRGIRSNTDTRDVVFDTLGGGRLAYVLTRAPNAVAVVDLERSTRDLVVRHLVPVGFGAARLALASFNVEGATKSFVLVSCYDSREIYVIDPEDAVTVAVLRGQAADGVSRDASRHSGPFDLAFVPGGGVVADPRLYVADFRASTVRVIDFGPFERCLLRGMEPDGASCTPVGLGTLGLPSPVGDIL